MNAQSRRLIALGSVFAMLLVSVMPAPVSAGGWATIELEEPVTEAAVGEETTFNFMVLQHGVSPVDYDRVHLTATHAESKTVIEVMANSAGEVGHYEAQVTFNETGRWNLEIEELDFGLKSSFPTLHVVERTAISIANTGFDQALLEIDAGTTVTWTNDDPIKHEVAFVDDSIDDSGILDSGESFSFTFDEPGKYTFACGPHPGMSGQIVVS